MRRFIFILICLTAAGVWAADYYAPPPKTTPDDIIFSHALHADSAGVECEICHTTADTSTTADEDIRPRERICLNCHMEVKDSTRCGMCHHNVQHPGTYASQPISIRFSHKAHRERKLSCFKCHAGVSSHATENQEHLPAMSLCYTCHDGDKVSNKCEYCHEGRITLADIHPTGWRHQHGERAQIEREWCMSCHRRETFCIDCHRGDNITGRTHDLNYRYTHGLDAQSKATDCTHCHDTKSFCDACHVAGNRMPLNHSSASWLFDHGGAARNNIEDCASCHDTGDPTCARGGCHSDADGIKGTDPRLHITGSPVFSHGPWHHDEGYFCYQCHVSTHQAGQGFCGYCHGSFGR